MEWKPLLGATGYIETKEALIGTYELAPGEIVLFDSGVEPDEALFQLLEEKKFHVRAVLSTHMHVDHIANNEELVRRHGTQIFAHSEEIRVLHIRREVDYPITEVDPERDVVIDGVSFRVVPTLGHSEGHLAYITPDNVCIIGDALLAPEKLRLSKLPYMEDVDRAIVSMEVIRATDCRYYIISHRGVVDRKDICGLIEDNIQKELRLYDQLRKSLLRPMDMDEAIDSYLREIGIQSRKVMDLGYVRWTARTRICSLANAGEFSVEGERVIPLHGAAQKNG